MKSVMAVFMAVFRKFIAMKRSMMGLDQLGFCSPTMQTGQWDSFELPQTHGFPMFGLSNPDSSGESFWWHWVLFGLLQFFFLPFGQKHTIIYEN